MPRESIQIPLDKIGIITNIDAKDIPDHYVTDSLNLDPDAPVGTVKSIKDLGSDLAYTNINSSTIARTFITSAGKTNIYTDKGKLEDLYIASPGTPTTTAHTTPLNITDISVNNAELRVCLSDANTPNRYIGYNKARRTGGVVYNYCKKSSDLISWSDYKMGDNISISGTDEQFLAILYGEYTGDSTGIVYRDAVYACRASGIGSDATLYWYVLKGDTSLTTTSGGVSGALSWHLLTEDEKRDGVDFLKLEGYFDFIEIYNVAGGGGGSGYSIGNLLWVVQGSNKTALIAVTNVDGFGKVTEIKLMAGGSGLHQVDSTTDYTRNGFAGEGYTTAAYYTTEYAFGGSGGTGLAVNGTIANTESQGLKTRPLYISNTTYLPLPTTWGDDYYFYIRAAIRCDDNTTAIDETTELLPPLRRTDLIKYSVGTAPTEPWIGFPVNGTTLAPEYWQGLGDVNGNDQVMDKDSYYRYKFSLIYDGIQESPLCQDYVETDLQTYNFNFYQIRIDCSFISSTNRWYRNRLTGIRLYRARRHKDDNLWSAYYEVGTVDLTQSPESRIALSQLSSTGQATLNVPRFSIARYAPSGYTYFDKLTSLDYNKAYYADDAWTSGTQKIQNNLQCIFMDNNTLGPSYEENTGYSEDVETTRLDYQLTEIFNGANYVSRVKDNTDLTVDGQFAIIKSKDGCFDMFNYFDNIMRLPEPPLQLKVFNNRLYAFGVNTLYIINPNLFIEDTLEGIGISKRTGYQFGIEPIVTNYGMFWADDRGAYWHNSKEIIEITDVIKNTFNKTSGSGWYGYNASTATYKSIAYNTGKKCIIFGYYIPPHYYMFVFHIPTKQWFKWSFSIHSNGYLFSGNQNDTYLIATYNSSTPVIKKLFAGTGYMAGTLTSKEYGQDLQYKKWYKFNMEENTVAGLTVTKEVSFDDASLSAITTSDLNKQKKKKMYFKLSWAANNGEKIIKAIEIIFRKLIGYR